MDSMKIDHEGKGKRKKAKNHAAPPPHTSFVMHQINYGVLIGCLTDATVWNIIIAIWTIHFIKFAEHVIHNVTSIST